MLTDLPIAAVRYAALLNRALYRGAPTPKSRLVNWIHHGTGLYEQVGFEDLPWLTCWPHETEIWSAGDAEARLAELARQQYRSDYGSADDITQVLAAYPDLVESDRHFLLTYRTLTRANAPDWHWHKNGPYIGTRNPVAEHLRDEPDIDQIITWNVWELRAEPGDYAGHWREELATWLVNRMAGQLLPPPDLPLR